MWGRRTTIKRYTKSKQLHNHSHITKRTSNKHTPNNVLRLPTPKQSPHGPQLPMVARCIPRFPRNCRAVQAEHCLLCCRLSTKTLMPLLRQVLLLSISSFSLFSLFLLLMALMVLLLVLLVHEGTAGYGFWVLHSQARCPRARVRARHKPCQRLDGWQGTKHVRHGGAADATRRMHAYCSWHHQWGGAHTW